MRFIPGLAVSALCALPAAAALPLHHAVVDLQATFTESPRVPGTGSWSKTRTFTVHVPCTVEEGPGAAMLHLPAGTASMVPGVMALYSFTPDKDREAEHKGTYAYREMDGGRLVKSDEGTLSGPFNGGLGLASGIHKDDLVMTPAGILTGFFIGTENRDGHATDFREAEGVIPVHGDLMNPMDPGMPRPTFSLKAFEASLAAGKPFSVTATKTYELDLKDQHYKGSYTVTFALEP